MQQLQWRNGRLQARTGKDFLLRILLAHIEGKSAEEFADEELGITRPKCLASKCTHWQNSECMAGKQRIFHDDGDYHCERPTQPNSQDNASGDLFRQETP